MKPALVPLREAPARELAGLRAVLMDIDDTLTLHGRLPARAYQALEDLHGAGLIAVPITGRPAGWCDHIARLWPVDGVVGENGAFYFRYDGAARRMIRIHAEAKATRAARQARLRAIAERIMADHPGTALAADQAYRETDIAIDFCEDVPPLPLAVAQSLKAAFEAQGATAKVSSIHVNAWFGAHDKLTMAKRLLSEVHGLDCDRERLAVAYAGDSPNDAPMFAFFPLSFGVANIIAFRYVLEAAPRYVTAAEGGHGFAELAQAILKARGGG